MDDFGAGVFMVIAIIAVFFIGMAMGWSNIKGDCDDFEQFSIGGTVYECIVKKAG